ncbi:inositol monophosphatase family protein [Parasedimentitalea psychrophila]|uniref:Inositol monophosphatase family protein n=1 Tax=Parasedimentitalea psychrophila TaxID=2997337 RepID=A0A9Y2KZZ5_9RHOB|nr:inositol monophosphatase family protein [Parasedimentitalea psychrophila]WIY25643.1 inositol monophosphatase family protein [Parasedimentitalea psychrophila]
MSNTRIVADSTVEFAIYLADQARLVSLPGFRKDVQIVEKNDLSPVTEIDRSVESFVRGMVEKTYPSHGFLGEEFGSLNLDAEELWVVDPIDGTRSFITGWPIWGTLLAKLRNGSPEIGLIDMPAIRERWLGICGKGCTFEDRSGVKQDCRVSSCETLAQARFYTTNILYFEPADRAKIEILLQTAAVPRFGGDCYSYGLLASGHVDLVVEAKLEPYDYFALIPVVESAGGIITDWSGNTLHQGSDGRVIAAATPQLHAAALEILQQI